ETLLAAVDAVAPAVELEIVGEGNARRRVEALAERVPTARIRDPVPEEELVPLLRSALAHVLTQRRISAGVNLPSKIATYLASGRPIIAALDPETAAAELLRRSGGALLVEPEDP